MMIAPVPANTSANVPINSAPHFFTETSVTRGFDLGNASLILIQETQHFFIGIHNETLSVAQMGVCKRKLLSFFGFFILRDWNRPIEWLREAAQ